jgi:hypothetical protein
MNKRIIMLAALAFAAVACGDDDETGPGVIIRTDASVPPIDAAVPSIDSSVPADSSTPDTGISTGVKGAPGCFAGKPGTSKELLNACAEGFVEFDNTKRIPGFTGTLPSL